MLLKNHPLVRRRLVHHSFSTLANQSDDESSSRKVLGGLAVIASAVFASAIYNDTTTACEEPSVSEDKNTTKTALHYLNSKVWTPALVDREDLDEMVDEHDDEMARYPVYTSEQVAENDGTDGKPIWMSYGGVSTRNYRCINLVVSATS